jgi:predicted GNAT family acetyltransferase
MTDFKDMKQQNRFEYYQDGEVVFANYRREGDTLFIDYVEAPPVLRGTGAAGMLMEKIIEIAEQENLTVKPICGYAAAWMRRHPQA